MWNISSQFREELRKPIHQPTIKAVVLDTNFNPVEDGTFYDDKTTEIQNYIVGGNVDVSTERGTRRTAELTLLNTEGHFDPAGDYDQWVGKFYINRAIRLYRGVVIGDDKIYAPIGTFLIDHAEVIVERNMSMVVLSMSDMWKKFTKSVFPRPQPYAAGTHLNTIIKSLAAHVGANTPLTPVLDPLTGAERNTGNTTLDKKLVYERGDNRGEELKNLCDRFGVDIYLDVMGRLTTNDRKDPRDLASVWTFQDSEDGSGMLITLRRNFNDDYLYNHVIVVGTGDPENIKVYEVKDTDPRSVTNIGNIGDRAFIMENDYWKTTDQLKTAAKNAWAKRFGINEEVVIETVCNPALDGDDVITIIEKHSGIGGRYRIKSMNIPLTSSLQNIRVNNLIRS